MIGRARESDGAADRGQLALHDRYIDIDQASSWAISTKVSHALAAITIRKVLTVLGVGLMLARYGHTCPYLFALVVSSVSSDTKTR